MTVNLITMSFSANLRLVHLLLVNQYYICIRKPKLQIQDMESSCVIEGLWLYFLAALEDSILNHPVYRKHNNILIIFNLIRNTTCLFTRIQFAGILIQFVDHVFNLRCLDDIHCI